jgi:hypothetical protein
MNRLSDSEQIQLKEALSHLYVEELKLQLETLKLSSEAFNKNELIQRLVHYAVTGNELPPLEIPAISKTVRGVQYPIEASAHMLYGTYKNDLKTRNFFKQLIGKHFHFTAQGIDWLREQWLAGKPPTYAEFAQEWQAEYERTKTQKRPPKQEWAYIRFIQEYIQQFPQASKEEANNAWKDKRQESIKTVNAIFSKKRGLT